MTDFSGQPAVFLIQECITAYERIVAVCYHLAYERNGEESLERDTRSDLGAIWAQDVPWQLGEALSREMSAANYRAEEALDVSRGR